MYHLYKHNKIIKKLKSYFPDKPKDDVLTDVQDAVSDIHEAVRTVEEEALDSAEEVVIDIANNAISGVVTDEVDIIEDTEAIESEV